MDSFPEHVYYQEILRSIGNLIGRTVRIDYHTQQAERGKFASVAVEIDLSKLLENKFFIDGEWQRIEYSGLPQICFTCGRAGHNMAFCPNKPCRPDQETPGASESPPQAAPVTGDSGITANTNKSYGEWMHAPRRQLRHRDTT